MKITTTTNRKAEMDIGTMRFASQGKPHVLTDAGLGSAYGEAVYWVFGLVRVQNRTVFVVRIWTAGQRLGPVAYCISIV